MCCLSHSTTAGKKSDNPLSPDYVSSLFAYLSPEQRQRKINSFTKFEQTQALKRKRSSNQDVASNARTHNDKDNYYSDSLPENGQSGEHTTLKTPSILRAVEHVLMKPAKQLSRN